MGKVIINSTTLENIANAIRAKTNSNEKLLPSEMPSAISSIDGGTTTGDVYISSYQPLKYEIVNPDPDHQSLDINPSAYAGSDNKIYVNINYSLSGSAGYTVGVASKYYDITTNTCVLNLTAPTLIADLNEQGYIVIYVNGNDYYSDYEGTQQTSNTLSGKVCLVKKYNNNEGISLSNASGSSLKELYIPELTDFDRTYFGSFNSSSAYTLNLPNITVIPSYGLSRMENLKTVILDSIETIEYDAFYDSDNLSTIVIRNTNQVCVQEGSFEGTDLSKIYVPDALFESYKSDTNWSWYYNNNYLYPLSEYVEE